MLVILAIVQAKLHWIFLSEQDNKEAVVVLDEPWQNRSQNKCQNISWECLICTEQCLEKFSLDLNWPQKWNAHQLAVQFKDVWHLNVSFCELVCVVVCVPMPHKVQDRHDWSDELKGANIKPQSSPASGTQGDNDFVRVNKLIKLHASIHTSDSLQSCKSNVSPYYSGNHLVSTQLPNAPGQRQPGAMALSSHSSVTHNPKQPALPCHVWHGNSVRLQPIRSIKTTIYDPQTLKVIQFRPPSIDGSRATAEGVPL